MLLVLIFWCYIFFTSFILGFLLNKMMQTDCREFAVIVFQGLFFATIFAGFWAVFGRINVEFHVALIFINLIVAVKFKTELIDLLRGFYLQFYALSPSLKWFLFLMGLLLLAQSAAPVNFVDNEIYYIQTIKWLTEYGFVKGLANLHFFLGQTSGWHILQSAFSFSFIGKNLNDINGFCLFMGNVFAVMKFSDFKIIQPRLLMGLFPLTNVVLFQFSGVPSPDLAVCVFAFVVFYYFIENFKSCTPAAFIMIFIFTVFMVFIKITTLPILLLPLLLFITNFKIFFRRSVAVYFLAMVVFALFVLKNAVLTGYPLFPSIYFKEPFAIVYAVPDEIYQFWFDKEKLYDFLVLKTEFKNFTVSQLFIKWLLYSKTDSIFNAVIVILLTCIPLLLRKFFNQKSYWILYSLMILQSIFLLATSPQYRFMLHFILFFAILAISCLVRNRKTAVAFLYFSAILVFFVWIFPVKINSQNAMRYHTSIFTAENIIFPSGISNLQTSYKPVQTGNIKYNSPNNTFIWATGDGPLPCLNQKQELFFRNRLGYIPQLRTKDLKDGFYSKKISNK